MIKQDSNVIAQGSSGGNSHVAEGSNVEVFTVDEGTTRVFKGADKLTHPDHKTVNLDSGKTYVSTRVKCYDPIFDVIREDTD